MRKNNVNQSPKAFPPWKNSAGKDLNDTELRFISGGWSKATWESFLESLETGRSEVLSSKFGELTFKSDLKESIEGYFNESEPEKFSLIERLGENRVARSLSVLTEKERLVIFAIFYHDLNQSETANVMKVSRARVGALLKKALRKIKKYLEPCLAV